MKHLLFFTGLMAFFCLPVFGQDLIPFYQISENILKGVVSYDGNWGYINKKGETVVKAVYDQAAPLHDGFAEVRKNRKSGVINAKGEEAIPCVADNMGKIREKKVALSIEGMGNSVVNMNQDIIVPRFRYAGFSEYSEGMIAFKKSGQWGFIDGNGKVKIEAKYDEVGPFKQAFAKVKLDGKYGFITQSGKEVIPLEYSSAGTHSDGFFPLIKDGKAGYVNKSNKIVIPFEFEEVSTFSDGIARVKKDGKYGAIDQKGKVIIPFIYDAMEPFSCGLSKVKKEGRTIFIDYQGVEKFSTDYEYVGSFSEGLALFTKLNHRGYIDLNGKEIISPNFDYASDFHDSLAYVEIDIDQRTVKGYINKKGKQYFTVPNLELERSIRETYDKMLKEHENDLAYFVSGYFKDVIVFNDGHKFKGGQGKYSDNFRIERVNDTRVLIHIDVSILENLGLRDTTRTFSGKLTMDLTYGDASATAYHSGKDAYAYYLTRPTAVGADSIITSAYGYYKPLDNALSLVIITKKLNLGLEAKRDYSHR